MSHLLDAPASSLADGAAFAAYREYLESIKTSLPAHVYEFAANESHYALNHPDSLHDAWLDNLLVVEHADGDRHQNRSSRISIRLLGAFQDRILHLHYAAVQSYELKNPSSSKGHGDLLIHELSLSESGALIHEIQFSTGAYLKIVCTDLEFRSEKIKS